MTVSTFPASVSSANLPKSRLPRRPAWRARSLAGGSTARRAAALAAHAARHLPEPYRLPFMQPEPLMIARLSELIDRWNAEAGLDDTEFRHRYIGSEDDARPARHLRAAAAAAARARNCGQLADAAQRLADAVHAAGIEGWPGFLDRAMLRARECRGPA